MLSSGLDTDGGGLTASKVTAVSGPILPINMVDTSTSLPIGVIEAVTPGRQSAGTERGNQPQKVSA